MNRQALAFIVFALLPAGASAQASPSQAAVDRAIDRGVAWLLKSQEADGSWPGPEPRLYRGMTSLAAYTLLKCGRRPDHAAIVAALGSVRAAPIERTYDSGCALMFLEALGDAAPKGAIKPIADRLVTTISNGRRSRGARWGYPNDLEGVDETHTDLSNTQYAVLGLRAARRAGYPAGSAAFWETLAKETLQAQEAYGGFGYKRGDQPSSSMTAAGITILAVCRDVLGTGIEPEIGRRIASATDRALQWLDTHWSVEHMVDLRFKDPKNDRWLVYFIYSIERLGAFLGRDRIGAHDWYAEGATRLLSTQKKQGQWDAGDADTCFALLFLRRGSGMGVTERTRSDEAGGLTPVTIASNGDNPLRAWVRATAPDLVSDKSAGRVVSISWVIDDVATAAIPVASVADLTSERCQLRHAFTTNGEHRVCARIAFEQAGAASSTVDSNVVKLVVDDREEAWHREAARDHGKNLIVASKVTATASSTIDASRTEASAADGRFGTRWVSGRDDQEPWIRLEFATGLRAGVLKLTPATWAGSEATTYARPRDVEIVVDGAPPLARRLLDAPRRKHTIVFGPSVVKSLLVRIKTTYAGTAEVNATGFNEIELFESQPEEGLRDAVVSAVRAEIVLPSARSDTVAWRHTFEEPAADWFAPRFDDGFWKEAPGGFGTLKSVLPRPRTPWKSKEIWIRRTFTLPKGDPGDLVIEVNHDDDAVVYVNGVLAARAPGFSLAGYAAIPITEAARATLRPGGNVIAARGTNTGGACYLDVGIVRLVPAP